MIHTSKMQQLTQICKVSSKTRISMTVTKFRKFHQITSVYYAESDLEQKNIMVTSPLYESHHFVTVLSHECHHYA